MDFSETLKRLKNIKGIWVILLAMCAGLLMIWIGGDKKEPETLQNQSAVKEIPTTEDYERTLEERLANQIRHLHGVSDVHVVVILESGSEYIYAQDGETSDNRRSREYVTIGSGSGESPILIRENAPKVGGVAVTVGNPSDALKLEIIRMICSLFDIPSNRVYVG